MSAAAVDTGVGRRPVNGIWVALLGVVFAALSILLLYAVISFWPPVPGDADPQSYPAQFLAWSLTISPESGLLMIVAVAGALGATAGVLRSFSRYAGERHLVWSWVPSYLLSPLVGALFATITYILLRAGLISGGQSTQGNPFGFVAVAALVGLFSGQAASKLKDIFETIFTKVEPGADAIPAGSAPGGASIEPESASEEAEEAPPPPRTVGVG